MIPYVALPAFVALIFKLALLGYAAWSPCKSRIARLFFALLAALAAQNAVEFVGFYYYVNSGLSAIAGLGFAYVALVIPIGALILHISLRLSFDFERHDLRVRLQPFLYVPGVVLLYLLLFTDHLVVGFQPFKNTVLRVPGAWYFLFETYMVGYFLTTLINLAYGSRPSRAPAIHRTRNRLWLLGIAPMGLLYIYLIIANHLVVAKITSTIYGPLVMTLPFVVAAYATYQQRLFDVSFLIPWSKARKRKAAFYHRVQSTISEMTSTRSVRDILQLLANTFCCPVALIGGMRPIVAVESGTATPTGAAQVNFRIEEIPRDTLKQIDCVIVAHEIEEARPDLHRLMRRHHISSIVPLHPHSDMAASWMLLGDRFSEEVYTPVDFQVVEQLFRRISDRFLDKLLLMRSQLDEVQREVCEAHRRLALLWQAKLNTDKKLLDTQTELQTLRNRTPLIDENPQTPKLACWENNQTLDEYLLEFEKAIVKYALFCAKGNRAEAARLLGLRPNTLHYKAKRLGLDN